MTNDEKTTPMTDALRDACIGQGWVPATCQLNGQLVWMLMHRGEDPCLGCNMDRAVCKGRPKGNRR